MGKYFRRSYIEDMYLKNGVYTAVGKAVPFVTVARQYVSKARIDEPCSELHGTFNSHKPWAERYSVEDLKDILRKYYDSQ